MTDRIYATVIGSMGLCPGRDDRIIAAIAERLHLTEQGPVMFEQTLSQLRERVRAMRETPLPADASMKPLKQLLLRAMRVFTREQVQLNENIVAALETLLREQRAQHTQLTAELDAVKARVAAIESRRS